MPSRISENPRLGLIMGLMIWLARAQLQQLGLGLVQVVSDVEADVKLLGNGLVRPARSSTVVDPLKADEKSVLTVETGAVGVRLRVGFEPGGLLIERRQSQRIRAIECYRTQLHLQRHDICLQPLARQRPERVRRKHRHPIKNRWHVNKVP
ncbi:hypothetical protein SAMN02787118_15212 [Streptomyces mirabilis]|uniref:Uncharacterized protein n=1 Tax=Streptomyces mirabilis TaxID=68239 RepID=A0A1I2XUP3_9ACTN|nr:hypothetical protein SAMN02787118_15212 [Streptomyces mirabilis]